jgi:trafficking protein particle complex subunit 10
MKQLRHTIQSGDYSGAANFFGKLIPIYSELEWSLISTEMLLMHAKCLKVLNRKDDYIRMLLGLLAKSVKQNKSSAHHDPNLSLVFEDIEQYTIDGRGILPELLAFSSQLPYEVTVDMATYFQDIAVDPYIRHYNDRDGFFLRLRFKSSFIDELKIDRATVVLLSVDDGPSGEIVLESDGPELVSGLSTIKVHSYVCYCNVHDHMSLMNF